MSLQVKQEALEKSYTTVSQQHKRMKVCVCGGGGGGGRKTTTGVT